MILSCPQCSSENEARRRFCNSCGGGLELSCAACGFSNRVGDYYCGGCGMQLAQAPAAPRPVAAAAPAPVEPERDQAEGKRDELRTITVMMADIGGLTELTNALGRERQTAILNEVVERMAKSHICDEFDGYIDKVLDGDVMALFGAPIAHEDAPERALRAAVRMHQTLQQLHEDGTIPAESPLTLRIGLNTGQVRVGGVGGGDRMEYTAMGDTVNLAARLMTACPWGASLISANTHRRVAHSFELQENEPIKVKGKSQPVRNWTVLAEKRYAGRLATSQEQGMSRIVGRAGLLETAHQVYQQIREGDGRVLAVCGEAGIGKSRLIFELQHQVAADEARFLEGRCLSYGQNLSHLPLRETLSQLAHIVDADSANSRLEKIRALLNEVGLSVDRQGPPLAFILGLDWGDRDFDELQPQDLRERLREGVVEAVLQAAAKQPVVLFIDDLQWCDADSLDILDALVRRAAEGHLLLLPAYRPDFTHEWEGLPQFQELRPRRLNAEETGHVLSSLLHQRGRTSEEIAIDPAFAAAVHHKSQGNPFFIEQTLTALLDRAEQTRRPTIDLRRGRLLVTEDELAQLVPDSVEEILLARIDRLPEDARALLQAASVAMIGRFFRKSALAWCLGGSDLDHRLEMLQSRELIRLENLSEDDAAYAFEHALARDVAYNNLLRSERRRLHGRVGAYIEHHYANSLRAYLDDLSYHYYHSAETTKALLYLPQSADRAQRSYSNKQSIMFYKRALEKAEELARDGGPSDLPQQRLVLLKGICLVQSLIGDREALDYGRQRLELARTTGDRDGVIDASYMLANLYTTWGMFDEAQDAWLQVRAEYQTINKWDGVRDTEVGIGNLHYLQGHYEEALEHFQMAMEVQTERLPFEPFGLWVAHNNLAAAYDQMGRYADMLESCKVCGELLGKLAPEDPMRLRLESYTAGNLGSANRQLGHLTAALAAYERALEISQETGEQAVEAEVRHRLGQTLVLCGRLTEARAQLDESVELARETGAARWEAGSLAALAELAMLNDDLDGAAQLLDQARALLAQVGELAGTAEVGIADATLHLARRQADLAAIELQEVLVGAERSHNVVDQARALTELARAEVALGRPELAREHADQAQVLAERSGLKLVLCRVLGMQAQLAAPTDRGAAVAAAARALALAAEMGAPEEQLAALGLHTELAAPGAARDALTAAEALLTATAAGAGADYAVAAHRRHLAAGARRLAESG